MMQHDLKRFALTVLGLATAFAARADGAFAPAVTVAFADTRTVAAHVQALGKGTSDMLLLRAVPSAILNSPTARLFGPMRPGSAAVAVCYVDAQVIARILATPATGAGRRKREKDLERAKHWTIYYPATVGPAALLKARPGTKTVNGCLAIPLREGARPPLLYAVYSADGKWVAASLSPILSKHTPSVAAEALKRPLGSDLAFISMNAAGSRAILQNDVCAGARVSVRMAPRGLELDGTIRMKALTSGTLPPTAFAFSAVPPAAPLFGVTMLPGQEIRHAGIFALIGPEVASFVGQALVLGQLPAGGVTAYHLPPWTRPGHAAPKAVGLPRARCAALMPEAFARRDLESVMFCSPTEVLRQGLPRVAAKMPIKEATQLELGVRLLKPVRGEGAGFMTWREGPNERFLLRLSRDELRGTVGLWSTLFL